MDRLDDMLLKDLLASLAAKTPAPGGGAAASIVGALSAALAGMVVSYSIGRKSLAEHQDRLAAAADFLARARALSMALADEDAAAYAAVNELTKLPEDDPKRRREWPAAAAAAVAAPRATLAAACDMLRLIEDLVPITNPNLRSDLVIAAICARAAAHAAWWNVRVNLPLASDQSSRESLRADCLRMLGEAKMRCERIEQACAAVPSA